MIETMDSSTVLAPRIIVADDEELALMLLQDGLKGMGFQPEGCSSGKDAILQSLRRPPEAILLDDKMSGLDSGRAIKMIRLMEPIRPVPILLLAEAPDRDTVVRSIQMGANDCLSKDSSLHDISLRLQRAIKAPLRQMAPAFEHLKYFFHYDGSAITLDIDSDITTDAGKNMVELVRALTGLMPIRFLLNLEKVPAISASGIGYLSDVKDTVVNCGGEIALCPTDMKRYLGNVQRFLEKYFETDAQAVSAKPSS
ncbi:response regulator [bacterium]|nr:response regulator [bacterium]